MSKIQSVYSSYLVSQENYPHSNSPLTYEDPKDLFRWVCTFPAGRTHYQMAQTAWQTFYDRCSTENMGNQTFSEWTGEYTRRSKDAAFRQIDVKYLTREEMRSRSSPYAFVNQNCIYIQDDLSVQAKQILTCFELGNIIQGEAFHHLIDLLATSQLSSENYAIGKERVEDRTAEMANQVVVAAIQADALVFSDAQSAERMEDIPQTWLANPRQVRDESLAESMERFIVLSRKRGYFFSRGAGSLDNAKASGHFDGYVQQAEQLEEAPIPFVYYTNYLSSLRPLRKMQVILQASISLSKFSTGYCKQFEELVRNVLIIWMIHKNMTRSLA
jgi:hypothetical protein